MDRIHKRIPYKIKIKEPFNSSLIARKTLIFRIHQQIFFSKEVPFFLSFVHPECILRPLSIKSAARSRLSFYAASSHVRCTEQTAASDNAVISKWLFDVSLLKACPNSKTITQVWDFLKGFSFVYNDLENRIQTKKNNRIPYQCQFSKNNLILQT